MKPADSATPWQHIYAKFDMSQSEFARALDRHRSKVSRALKDAKGLISGRDQELILEAAQDRKIAITADDLMPRRK